MFRLSVRLASFLTACAAMALGAGAAVASPRTTSTAVPGEVLVSFKSAPRSVSDLGKLTGYQPKLKTYRLVLRSGITPAAAISRLRSRTDVAYAERNNYLYGCSTPNDTYYAASQYNLPKIQANLAYDIWQPRSQTILAIVGSGVQATHPDLMNVMYRDGLNAVIGYNSLDGTTNANDDNGHDTFNAGLAAAEVNNATGVAGVAGWNPGVAGSKSFVKIMPIKALNSLLVGTDASISQGIIWAADHGADVINLSFAGATFSATVDSAVQYAWGKGCVLVASVGNAGKTTVQYPAGYNNVISVGATDKLDVLWASSQYGPWVKVLAPGVSVTSTYTNGAYNTTSGSSASAPQVSGAAAVILAQNPTLTNLDVSRLITTQVDAYTPYQGRTIAVGAGRLNVYKALQTAGVGIPDLTAVTISPNIIPNATTASACVFIGGPAPAGGTTITLTSSNTAVATVPPTVVIPGGSASAVFTVTGKLIGSNATATIIASDGVISKNADITVRGPVPTAVTVSPTSVIGGTPATGTVTLDTPAPAAGSVVALVNSSIFTQTPGTVTVPAGLKTATFQIKTVAPTSRVSATITATLNGISKIGNLLVNVPTPTLTVQLSPTSVFGGANATGTISLGTPAPVGGTLVTLSSNDTSAATVPLSILVPETQTTGTFPITTSLVAGARSVTIKGTAGTITGSAILTVKPLVTSLTLSPTSVIGGVNSAGKILLGAAAPAGGLAVTLRSSNGAAIVPASVTVLAGATSASFVVTTVPVTANAAPVISGSSAGGSGSATLTVLAPILKSLTVSPTSVTGGTNAVGTITLSGNTPTNLVVALASNNAAATVPPTATVLAGTKTATFPITTTPVTVNATAAISGTSSLGNGSANLAVLAPVLKSVTLSPTSVTGGTGATGTVTLSGPAIFDVDVTLASNNAVAGVPPTVTILAGAKTATFAVATIPVAANTTAAISASSRIGSVSANLTILASVLKSVTVSPVSVVGGAGATGTVTFSGNVISNVTVTLASNNAAASVPASVTVLAGTKTATFPITTAPVAADAATAISATSGAVTVSAKLTVLAPLVSSVTLNPTSVIGGTGSTGTVVLTGIAASSVVVTLRSNNAAAGVLGSVTVPVGARSATFPITTSAVTASTAVTVSAITGAVTKTALLTVKP